MSVIKIEKIAFRGSTNLTDIFTKALNLTGKKFR